MVEKKKEVKVEDFSELVKGIGGLVKDSYLSGLEFTLSLWEENQRFIDSQIEQFFKVQKGYIEQLQSALERLPKDFPSLYPNGNLDRLTSAQREYVKLVRNVSDKFTKDLLNLTHKAAEKAFAAFEESLNLFKS